MTAFNVVRFRVKPGQEKAFLDAHRKARRNFKGLVDGWIVATGERTFCFIGQWKSFKNIVAARPQMIAVLDTLRPMLEDLGNGLGLTDPVSGDAALRLVTRPRATSRAPGARKTAVAKSRATKAKVVAKKAAGKPAATGRKGAATNRGRTATK